MGPAGADVGLVGAAAAVAGVVGEMPDLSFPVFLEKPDQPLNFRFHLRNIFVDPGDVVAETFSFISKAVRSVAKVVVDLPEKCEHGCHCYGNAS